MQHNTITPLTYYPKISDLLNINLFVKHDDLYPVSGGGSKARKLNYILNDHVKKKYNAIVSAGGNQSNHLRTTALFAANLGWKAVFIVHDAQPERFQGNLKIMNLSGAELFFVDKEEVKETMDQAMENLKSILEEAGSSLDRLLKVTIFLQDMGNFKRVNEAYGSFFSGDYPARCAYQVAKLPLGADIEIDGIAAL